MVDRSDEARSSVATRMLPVESSQRSSRRSTLLLPKRLSKLNELMLCQNVEINLNHESIDVGRSKFMFFMPNCNSLTRRDSNFKGCGSQNSLATEGITKVRTKLPNQKIRGSTQSRLSALRLPRNSQLNMERVVTAQSRLEQSKDLQTLNSFNRDQANYFPSIVAPIDFAQNSRNKKPAGALLKRSVQTAPKGYHTKTANCRRSEFVAPSGFKNSPSRLGSGQGKRKAAGKENSPKIITKKSRKVKKPKRPPAGEAQFQINQTTQQEDSSSLQRMITPREAVQDIVTVDELQSKFEMISEKPVIETPVSNSVVQQLSVQIVVHQPSKAEIQQLKQCLVEAAPAVAKISSYDDLFLSDDFRNMSDMYIMKDEGSYHSSLTSYDEMPVLKKENEQILVTEQAAQQKQLCDLRDTKDLIEAQPVSLAVCAAKQDSNYELLKSQLQETQFFLSKLLKQSRIEAPKEKSPQKLESRAPILQFAHVDGQLRDLYLTVRSNTNTFLDCEFEITSESTGVPNTIAVSIEDIPRISTDIPVLFKSDLGEVITANAAHKTLCTVLNLLARNSPDMIRQLFEPVSTDLSGRPMFGLWLNVDGQFNPIFLDANLPYDSQSLEPLFCYSKGGGQVWPELIEKAIAKSVSGYQHIEELTYQDLLFMITGMRTHQLNLSTRSDQAWRSLMSAIDNGCFIFAEDEGRIVYVDNYAANGSRQLYVHVNSKLQSVSFEELCQQCRRVLIANISPAYHFNYHHLSLATGKTLVTELKSHGRTHLFVSLEHSGLTIEQRGQLHLSMCIYRVEEELLKLVAEKSLESRSGIWVELILKKGLYKIFVSSQPLRLAEVEAHKATASPYLDPTKTDRTNNNINLILTVTSKDNLRCEESIDTLRKQGDSRLVNQSVSYQAVKASSLLSPSQSQCLSLQKNTYKSVLQKSIKQPPHVQARNKPFLTSRNMQSD